MPILLLENESGEAREELLRDPDTTIGRASYNHVVIDVRRVSRIHAVLTRYGPFVSIRDLGSTNGTYVNGSRVTNQVLVSGDTIEIGGIMMRFFDSEQQLAVATAVAPAHEAVLPVPPPPPAPPPPAPAPAPPEPSPPHPADDLMDDFLHDELDELMDDDVVEGVPFAEWIEDTVAFHFPADGREVPALITYEALEDHFSAGSLLGDPDIRSAEAYRQNAAAINRVAARRYALGRREPVFLRTTDF